MYITTELLLQIVPALEEVDKAMSTASAADQMMIGQTDILFTMGFQDQSLMKAGFATYSSAFTGFKTDMLNIIDRFQTGKYTYSQAMNRWKGVTGARYKEIFAAGTKAIGNPFYDKMGLTKKDMTFINGARRFERRFMSKLLLDIENPEHTPKFRFPKSHPYSKLPPYMQRALAYAESGKAQFYNGMLAGAGSKMDVYWVLGVPQLDHCNVCPIYANRKWTWKSLPTVPRAGGTPCLFRCYCHLEFKPKAQAKGFDLAGRATEGALRAAGKQARVYDSRGVEVGGVVQAEVEEIYAHMYKARQMMRAEAIRGNMRERMAWVKNRMRWNKELIEKLRQGNYRATPTVSVRDLVATIDVAAAKGGKLVQVMMDTSIGSEVIFIRGDFSTKGIIRLINNRRAVVTPSGKRFYLADDTDIVYLLKTKKLKLTTETITNVEVDAIHGYSTLGYRKMRAYLRMTSAQRTAYANSGVLAKEWAEQAELLEKMFGKYEDGARMETLYRGLADVKPSAYQRMKAWKRGEVVEVDTHFSSWSLDYDTSLEFLAGRKNAVQFVLKGNRVTTQELAIQDFSLRAGEQEVLVATKKFKVTRVKTKKVKVDERSIEVLEVHLEEIK